MLAKTRAELGERDSEISRLRLSLDQMEQISSYNQLKEENAILRYPFKQTSLNSVCVFLSVLY